MTGARRDRRGRGHRVLPWAAGMAAAGLVIGLLTGRVLWTEPTPTTVAQVALDTLDTKQHEGRPPSSTWRVGWASGVDDHAALSR